MTAFARLAQFEHRAPGDDFAPVRDEAFQHLLEIEQARLAIDQRNHVHAEAVLHLCLLEQIVQHHFGHLAALELDHYAHTGFVRFVLDMGNAFDLFLVHQLGDFFEQRAFVHLIGQLVDDDGLTIVALGDVFEVRARTHDDAATAGAITIMHARQAVDQRGRGEVRCRHDLDQLFDIRSWICQQDQTGIDDFGQVVRWDIRCHPDRDAGAAIDEQVGNACRQHGWFEFLAIVVRLEVDRLLVDIGQQIGRDFIQTAFCITHRRRVIAINRAEVTLTIYQHVAQGKVLRHAYQSVIN